MPGVYINTAPQARCVAFFPGTIWVGRASLTWLPADVVLLTFDDGPNDPWTPRLLEVLERHGVRATFFMIGKYVAQHSDVARMVRRAMEQPGYRSSLPSYYRRVDTGPAGIPERSPARPIQSPTGGRDPSTTQPATPTQTR